MNVRNRTLIADTLKILIYKENPDLIKYLDLDNDEIFLDPFLFTYFFHKKNSLPPSTELWEILQGYVIEIEDISINDLSYKNNIAYLPNLGYFKKEKKSGCLA